MKTQEFARFPKRSEYFLAICPYIKLLILYFKIYRLTKNNTQLIQSGILPALIKKSFRYSSISKYYTESGWSLQRYKITLKVNSMPPGGLGFLIK